MLATKRYIVYACGRRNVAGMERRQQQQLAHLRAFFVHFVTASVFPFVLFGFLGEPRLLLLQIEIRLTFSRCTRYEWL